MQWLTVSLPWRLFCHQRNIRQLQVKIKQKINLRKIRYEKVSASESVLDHLSSFTTTSSDGSPPYSHSASEQHESPEGTGKSQTQHKTPDIPILDYHRSETPSSAQLNVDFANTNGGYSPDNVATSSERDESPDTISTSSVGATETTASCTERADPKANLSASQIELQKGRRRRESFFFQKSKFQSYSGYKTSSLILPRCSPVWHRVR